MKLMVEGMTTAFLLAIVCGLLSSIIGVSVQANEARNYHSVVVDQLENSYFRQEVQQYLLDEAEQKGYKLNIEKISNEIEEPAYLVTLDYQVSMPVFQLFGSPLLKEGSIEGFAK